MYPGYATFTCGGDVHTNVLNRSTWHLDQCSFQVHVVINRFVQTFYKVTRNRILFSWVFRPIFKKKNVNGLFPEKLEYILFGQFNQKCIYYLHHNNNNGIHYTFLFIFPF